MPPVRGTALGVRERSDVIARMEKACRRYAHALGLQAERTDLSDEHYTKRIDRNSDGVIAATQGHVDPVAGGHHAAASGGNLSGA